MPEDNHQIQHIAFIPDGNRRWASEHKLRNLLGHRMGFETIQRSYDWLVKRNIKYATFYAFSTENWKRSSIEISYLLDLFRSVIDDSIKEFPKKDVRFICIGDWQNFPEDIRCGLEKLMETTKDNKTLTLIVAIGYSGRNEIVRAAKKIAQNAKDNCLEIEDITEDTFADYLDTKGIPDPDIVVRTSERRISNYLLWQMAYSEIFFIDKYWPDFTEEDFDKVIEEFSNRVRRYGR